MGKKQQKNKWRFHRHRSASIHLLVHSMNDAVLAFNSNRIISYIAVILRPALLHHTKVLNVVPRIRHSLSSFHQTKRLFTVALQDHECTYVVHE
jgi:hypothetical protein